MAVTLNYPQHFSFDEKLDYELAKRSRRTGILYAFISPICLITLWSKEGLLYSLIKFLLFLVILSSPLRWYVANHIVKSEKFLKNWSFVHKNIIFIVAFLWSLALSLLTYHAHMDGWEGSMATLLVVAFTVGSIVSLAPSRFFGIVFPSILTISYMIACFFGTQDPSFLGRGIAPLMSLFLLLYCISQAKGIRKELYASINFETSLIQSTNELLESQQKLEASKRATLEAQNREMERDLSITAAVQSMLLPENQSIHREKYEITSFYKPAVQCGGDWWWVHETSKDLYLFVGDVTGHGAGSAMITAAIAASFHLLEDSIQSNNFEKLIHQVHLQMVRVAKMRFFMTGVAIQLNLETLELTSWSFGGPHIIVTSEGKKTIQIGEPGTPFGSPTFAVQSTSFQLSQGSRFFIVTDGIADCKLSNGFPFGEARLSQLLSDLKSEPLQNIPLKVFAELQTAAGPFLQDDDFTLVGVDVK